MDSKQDSVATLCPTRMTLCAHEASDAVLARTRPSLPHQLVGEVAEVCLRAAAVEVVHDGARSASHARSHDVHKATTPPEHMPENHREWAHVDPSNVNAWAEAVGPMTARYVRGA